MFKKQFTTNFSQNAAVKKFENRSIFGKDMDKILWLTFLGHPVESPPLASSLDKSLLDLDPCSLGPQIRSPSYSCPALCFH